MTDVETRRTGPLRSVVLAVAAIPLAVLSFAGTVAAWKGLETSYVARLPAVAAATALILAILAIWLGDEVTQRGGLGRRIGMIVVVATIGANLVGQAMVK